jgi:hypothetical protein
MEKLSTIIALIFLFIVVFGCSRSLSDDREWSALPYHIMGIGLFLLIIMIFNLFISME